MVADTRRAVPQGKTIAAGADIGRMAVEVGMLMPETPTVYVVLRITIAILVQLFASYTRSARSCDSSAAAPLMGDALNGRAVNVIGWVTTWPYWVQAPA